MADDTQKQPSPSDYLWSVAAKKISIMAGKAGVALIGTAIARKLAYKYGFNVNIETFQAQIAGAILLGTEWLHDWLKVKTGKSWL